MEEQGCPVTSLRMKWIPAKYVWIVEDGIFCTEWAWVMKLQMDRTSVEGNGSWYEKWNDLKQFQPVK